MHFKKPVPIKRISSADKHFFFGYYDRIPISKNGRYHLAIHPQFADRSNTESDKAPLCIIDLQDKNKWIPLDENTAWNWQMGANAQWLGSSPDSVFIYNVREKDRIFARIRDISSNILYDLPLPVYDVSKDGRYAITVNFARIHTCRPGYGYTGIIDYFSSESAPKNDGIFFIDLKTGNSELIVSLDQCRSFEPELNMKSTMHWFNHIMISPNGSHIMFLHRWQPKDSALSTRLFICNRDGTNLSLINRGPIVSHCDWRDENHILSFCQSGEKPPYYYLLDINSKQVEVVGENLFNWDGHCHYYPLDDKRWFVTDTYPDFNNPKRTLIIFDTYTNTRFDIGEFLSLEGYEGEIRCDLHSRWDNKGKFISFDSMHEGYRGIYLADVSNLIKKCKKLKTNMEE